MSPPTEHMNALSEIVGFANSHLRTTQSRAGRVHSTTLPRFFRGVQYTVLSALYPALHVIRFSAKTRRRSKRDRFALPDGELPCSIHICQDKKPSGCIQRNVVRELTFDSLHPRLFHHTEWLRGIHDWVRKENPRSTLSAFQQEQHALPVAEISIHDVRVQQRPPPAKCLQSAVQYTKRWD